MRVPENGSIFHRNRLREPLSPSEEQRNEKKAFSSHRKSALAADGAYQFVRRNALKRKMEKRLSIRIIACIADGVWKYVRLEPLFGCDRGMKGYHEVRK